VSAERSQQLAMTLLETLQCWAVDLEPAGALRPPRQRPWRSGSTGSICSRANQLRPAYLKLNPNGMARMLVHNGAPVIGCSMIVKYLEGRVLGRVDLGIGGCLEPRPDGRAGPLD
jgi:hypothetical protein